MHRRSSFIVGIIGVVALFAVNTTVFPSGSQSRVGPTFRFSLGKGLGSPTPVG